MCLLYLDGCTDNRLGLHNCDLRIGYGQTASSVTHHRVELVETGNDGLDLLNGLAHLLCKRLDLRLRGRNELMKRRIQETDGNRVAFHRLEELSEVILLIRLDLLECLLTLFNCIGADHLTECFDSLRIEEHVLCTTETDTLCTKLTCLCSIVRCIRVSSYAELSILVRPAHDTTEVAGNLSIYCSDLTLVDVTGSTIDGDEITLLDGLSAECELLVLLIHHDITAAGYAALTHTTGNNGCMAGHTATNGQDTLGRLHTCDILWGSLETNKDDLLATCVPRLCILCSEDNLTTCSSRGSTEALTHRNRCLQRILIELRVKECIEVTRIDHRNGFLLASHALIYEVAGDLQRSLCGSLTISGLQHVQLTVLNGELHILHISIMLLEGLAYLRELCECLRELLLHLLDVHRCTNTCYDVLALCVRKELTEEALCTGSRISREGYTGTTVITHVTECHGLYVYSGTPGIRDIVITTINVCTWVIP